MDGGDFVGSHFYTAALSLSTRTTIFRYELNQTNLMNETQIHIVMPYGLQGGILDFFIQGDNVIFYFLDDKRRNSAVYRANLNNINEPSKFLSAGYFPGLASAAGPSSFYALDKQGFALELDSGTGKVIRTSSQSTASSGYEGFGLTLGECEQK